MSIGDIASELGGLYVGISEMIKASQKMHGSLVPIGQKFLALAVTLTVVNDVYQWWIKGDITEAIAKAIRLFVVTSIPLTLLVGNGAWVHANETLINFFQTGVTRALGATSGGDLEGLIKDVVRSVVDAVNVTPPSNGTEFKWLDPTTWTDAIKNSVASLGGLIIEFVLKVIVFIGVVLMMIAMLVAGYIPLVALQVGVITGPLLVSWLPFEPMSNYAHTWLKFMIVNSMTIVVAVILLLMVKAGIGAITGIVGLMLKDGVLIGGIGAIAAVFMVLSVLAFVAYMLLQSDVIAGGLIGHSSVGGGYLGQAIGKMMGAGMKGGGKAASAGAGKAGLSITSKAGKAADSLGKSAQAGAVSLAIDGRSGGAAMATAGNALRSVGRGMEKATNTLAKDITGNKGKDK